MTAITTMTVIIVKMVNKMNLIASVELAIAMTVSVISGNIIMIRILTDGRNANHHQQHHDLPPAWLPVAQPWPHNCLSFFQLCTSEIRGTGLDVSGFDTEH